MINMVERKRTYSHHAVACKRKLVNNNLNFAFENMEFSTQNNGEKATPKNTNNNNKGR